MVKLAEREKSVGENKMRDNDDLFNDVSYFSNLLCQQKPPSKVSRVSLLSPEHSSCSSSFSNGFCSPDNGSPYADGAKRIVENIQKDGEMFNDVSNMPYLSFLRQQKILFNGSQASRVSPQPPELSPSSSVFPNWFSSSDNASLHTPLSEEVNYQTPCSQYWNGLCLDSKSPHDSYRINERSVDEMGLSQSLRGMSIREDQNDVAKMKGFRRDLDGFGYDYGSLGASVKNYGSFGSFSNGDSDIEGFQYSPYGVSWSSVDNVNCTCNSLHGGFGREAYDSMGSSLAHNQSNDLCSGSVWSNNQSDYLLERRKDLRESWNDWGVQSQNKSCTRLYLDDPLSFSQQSKVDFNGRRRIIDSGAPQAMNPKYDLNVYDPLRRVLTSKERIRSMKNSGFVQSLVSMNGEGDMETYGYEDSFIIPGRGLNPVSNKGFEPLSSDKRNCFNEMSAQNLRGKNIELDNCALHGRIWENDQRLSSYYPLSMSPSISSLSEVQGNIYLTAQDQNGCRWLQRIFDEGTSQDVQIIFSEIIDHIIELMLKPFGNYVIQKFLDVCTEDQRLQIVYMVTEKPGQLVGICLNTYGTRAAQKLIETLKTRQQISFVTSALKPGFLDLVKDQNGNHVIQRCLQCLSHEDNKFIFDAAAKFCLEIATYQHGCCVMQRCMTHATGKHRDKLLTEISKNSLLLALDQYGNYVVQFIIDLKSTSAIANLLSQFEKNYVHLSMQKFSSHVVEKCLKQLEESREQIIRELLSVSRFDKLLQDPYANYVIQSALAVTTKDNPLHSLLVAEVNCHSDLRANPYSKRIFSRNLSKK